MTLPTTFITAFNLTMKWEGSTYVSSEYDRGGQTKYGISQRAFPDINIRELTKYRAMLIYFAHYWSKGRCDKLPKCIAIAHFDACVNVGVKRAAVLLQKALGVTADGIIGPKTTAAAAEAKGCDILTNLGAMRVMHYVNLVIRHPKQMLFMYGWVRRTFDVTLTARSYDE